MQTTRSAKPWLAVSLGALVLLAFSAVGVMVTLAATSAWSGAPGPTETDQMRTDIALLRAQVQKLETELSVVKARAESLQTLVEALPTGAPRMQPLAKDIK